MDDMLEALHSGDRLHQLKLLRELTAAKRSDAVPAVLPLLSSSDSTVREASARFLGMCAPLGDEDVGARLVACLDDSDVLVRAEVAVSLGLLCYMAARLPLEQRVRDDAEWLVRVSAIEGLESLGREESFATLATALSTDEHAQVQRYAADALRVIARPEHLDIVESLAAAQQDEPINAISLFFAAYRLGKAEYLAKIQALFDGGDDSDDMNYLLHVLTSAYTGPLSPHVIADIPRWMQTLDALAQRLPDMQVYCAEFEGQLSAILQGNVIPSNRSHCHCATPQSATTQ